MWRVKAHLLIGDDQLDDGQAVEDGNGEQVPVVHHGLPGEEQVVLPGQVRHEQERLRPENVLIPGELAGVPN